MSEWMIMRYTPYEGISEEYVSLEELSRMLPALKNEEHQGFHSISIRPTTKEYNLYEFEDFLKSLRIE